MPARDALSGPATAPDDPASAFLTAARPARPRTSPNRQCRPCGFPPCEHDAVRLDMRTTRLRFRTPAAPRGCGAWTCSRNELSIGRSCRDRPVKPIRSAQKRPVTSSATASLIRRSQPVMHRRMHLRDVPLPARTFAAWPIRVVLPSARVGGAHGVLAPFAGLLPRRVAGHFCPAGPTCLFVQPHAPIDFRRVDLPPLEER